MLLTVANIVYVLIALAMTILILLQRGAGAAAGSGFGGGASATVFGARGSANFLSKSTAILATLFFVLSLGMAMYASRSAQVAPTADDLGVMGAMEVPVAPTETPAAAESEVPTVDGAAPAPAPTTEPAPATDASAATTAETPAVEADESK